MRLCVPNLTTLGFTVHHPTDPGSSVTSTRGTESLHAHPNDLSGYVVEDTTAAIAEGLQNATTFRLTAIDAYERAYHYTPEELTQALESVTDTMRARILEAFRTQRRNLFRSEDALLQVRSGLAFFHRPLRTAPYLPNVSATHRRGKHSPDRTQGILSHPESAGSQNSHSHYCVMVRSSPAEGSGSGDRTHTSWSTTEFLGGRCRLVACNP